MIEWFEYDKWNPPISEEFYLATNGDIVDVCTCENDKKYGYTWWNRDGSLFPNVTHYAKINLPSKRTMMDVLQELDKIAKERYVPVDKIRKAWREE